MIRYSNIDRDDKQPTEIMKIFYINFLDYELVKRL